MAEIGLTPQNITPPAPPRSEGQQNGQPRANETAPQTALAVDQLQVSPEAEQRLSELQASDDSSVASTQLAAESEESPAETRGTTDFARQQAISNFQTGGGLFEPPPELFDQRV